MLPFRRPGPSTGLSRWFSSIVLGVAMLFAAGLDAGAEVRFGSNVRIGGNDFSHRSFDRKRRAVIHLYDRAPPRSGCRWRADGRGGQVQTCHLERLR